MPPVIYKKQKQILEFIKKYIEENGHSPTLTEIAQAFGLKSLATVHEHLQNLTRKGLIRRFEGAIRGIEVLDKRAGEILSSVELPLFGYIQAGSPIEPYPDPSAKISIAPFLLSGKKRAYVLQVKGDSMIDDGILDGDFVVVEEQEIADEGDIVVALLESGVATLKRFYKEKDRIRLEPANATMQPIYATNVKIQGKVVGVVRRY